MQFNIYFIFYAFYDDSMIEMSSRQRSTPTHGGPIRELPIWRPVAVELVSQELSGPSCCIYIML